MSSLHYFNYEKLNLIKMPNYILTVCFIKLRLGMKNNFYFFIYLDLLQERNLELTDIIAVTLYVRDMTEFLNMNAQYASIMCRISPPVRVCVEIPLSEYTPILMDVVAYKPPSKSSSNSNLPSMSKHTMHVQSISHWAPANIGPYSQAIRVS